MLKQSLIVTAAFLSFVGGVHAAEDPGSLLVFPVFNNQEGFVTLLTVTNVSDTRPVIVRFNYVDGENCELVNYDRSLSPNDTFTCLTRPHNFAQPNGKGYVRVHAISPFEPGPIAFNNLVGTSLIVDGVGGGGYALNPFVFRGLSTEGDVNGNGRLDLNGVEYARAPGKIIIPRFLGQAPTDSTSSLILIDAAGGAGWQTGVNIIAYNDNEELFSASYAFECWSQVELLDISGIFSSDFLKFFTNDDPQEVFGLPQVESGWLTLRGASAWSDEGGTIQNPAILAVLLEPNSVLQTAAAPFQVGKTSGSFAGL